jgi:hypothetical protein
MLEDRSLPSVVLGTSFAGLAYPDSGGCVPPDTIAAAGPSHVVELVNNTIAFYSNPNGTRVSQQSLTAFFSPLGGVLALTDPVVSYDELRGRFVVGELDYNATDQSRFDFAVSNDSDPTHGFTLRRFEMNDGVGGFGFADFPRLGWNADAYVVSFDMFTNHANFDHVDTLSIDKNSLAGFRQVVPQGPLQFTSLAPATMHGALPGGPMWFVGTGALSLGQSVRVVQMTNVLSNNSTYTTFQVSVPSSTATPAANQPRNGGLIDTNDDRILNAAWRNNRLVASQTVGFDGSAHARWYDFNTGTAAPTLTEEGEINRGPGVNTYFPSIEIAANGDLGMTFNESSSSEFMSMYVTGRRLTDAPGTMQTPVLSRAGQAIYGDITGAVYRAGDYSGISVDPTATATFWAANEFATAASTNNWGTWITAFRLSQSHRANNGSNVVPLFSSAFAAGQPVGGTATAASLWSPTIGVSSNPLFAPWIPSLAGLTIQVTDLGQAPIGSLTITTEQSTGNFTGTFSCRLGPTQFLLGTVMISVSGTLSPYNLFNGDLSTITFHGTTPRIGALSFSVSFTGTVSMSHQISGTAQLGF